jgi:hypothetical protein
VLRTVRATDQFGEAIHILLVHALMGGGKLMAESLYVAKVAKAERKALMKAVRDGSATGAGAPGASGQGVAHPTVIGASMLTGETRPGGCDRWGRIMSDFPGQCAIEGCPNQAWKEEGPLSGDESAECLTDGNEGTAKGHKGGEGMLA